MNAIIESTLSDAEIMAIVRGHNPQPGTDRHSALCWTADDEIAWLRKRKPGWQEYCRIILAGERRWDASVDVARVVAEARRLLAE